MDIEKAISALIEKVKSDDSFKKKFTENPIQAVEEVVGVDLPDEKIKEVVEAVKAKIGLDSIADKLGGLFG